MVKSSRVLKNGVKFSYPEPEISKKMKCIYKLTFDSGKFYIGSTSDLFVRVKCYTTNINKSVHPNKSLNEESKKCSSVDISVLEVVDDVAMLRPREDFILKAYFNNNCLNRSNCAFSNKGILWTAEERLAISKSMKGLLRSDETKAKMSKPRRKSSTSRPVFQYDLKGNFIKEFASMQEASKHCNLCADTISKITSGKMKSSKGLTFRSEKEPPIGIESLDKLEILNKYDQNVHFFHSGKNDILKAMEEYGKKMVADLFKYPLKIQ